MSEEKRVLLVLFPRLAALIARVIMNFIYCSAHALSRFNLRHAIALFAR